MYISILEYCSIYTSTNGSNALSLLVLPKHRQPWFQTIHGHEKVDLLPRSCRRRIRCVLLRGHVWWLVLLLLLVLLLFLENIVQGRRDGGYLSLIAKFRSHGGRGRIGIHFRRGDVGSVRDTSTQAQRGLGQETNAGCHGGQAQHQGSIGHGRGNVCDGTNAVSNGTQKLHGIRGILLLLLLLLVVVLVVFLIAHDIKAIGNGIARIRLGTGLGKFGRSKFCRIGIGRFVQIQMTGPGNLVVFGRGRSGRWELVHQVVHQGLGFRCLLFRIVWDKTPIGIQQVGLPALFVFVRPRTDTGDHDPIDVGVIVQHFGGKKQEAPLHPRRFVAMHPSGNQDIG